MNKTAKAAPSVDAACEDLLKDAKVRERESEKEGKGVGRTSGGDLLALSTADYCYLRTLNP